MDNEFLENTLTIDEPPKQNFHYRYPSELGAGNTHGALNGKRGNHPKITLLLPENAHLDEHGNVRDFYVLCTFHSIDNGNKILSPHLLQPKGETEPIYNLIFEKMKSVEGHPSKRFWELNDYVIVRVKGSDYIKSFSGKRESYARLPITIPFTDLLGQLDLNNRRSVKDSGKLKNCLGFQIFERDFYTNTYTLYRDRIYSCNIYHGDDLKIYKLCNTKGSVLGGTEVTILIRFEANLQLNVRIRRIDERTHDTLWETTVEIRETFCNTSITFTMPPYTGPSTTADEIKVYLNVVVEGSTYKSDDVKFYYINEKTLKRKSKPDDDDDDDDSNGGKDEKENVIGKKIKKPKTMPSDQRSISIDCSQFSKCKLEDFGASSARNISGNIRYKIDAFFNNSKTINYVYPLEGIDNVFYEALESKDALYHLYKTAKNTGKTHLIADFRNQNRENLLHWACQKNHYEAIRPLIGLGCKIDQQDYLGRTALHVALVAQNTESVLEIQKLILDHSEYPTEVETNFIEMFKIYNHNGRTVVHEAVLLEYNDLFDIMMIFLAKHDINVLDYEVLGSGESIVHLAVENNLMKIWPLIQKHVPNYKLVKNYSGLMIKDLDKQVLEKLNI